MRNRCAAEWLVVETPVSVSLVSVPCNAVMGKDPAVDRVIYPGLPSHLQHALAMAQLNEFGSVVTFDLRGVHAAAKQLAESLALFATTSNVGSVDSLMLPPQHLTPAGMTAEEKRWVGITEHLSVGIESIDDLLGDLEQAFGLLRY